MSGLKNGGVASQKVKSIKAEGNVVPPEDSQALFKVATQPDDSSSSLGLWGRGLRAPCPCCPGSAGCGGASWGWGGCWGWSCWRGSNVWWSPSPAGRERAGWGRGLTGGKQMMVECVCVRKRVFALPLGPGPDPGLRHCVMKLLPQNLNKWKPWRHQCGTAAAPQQRDQTGSGAFTSVYLRPCV